MVCKEIKVKGQVSFGASTIIHPGVTIIAEAGPIEIGENNIIEEYVNIIHKWVVPPLDYIFSIIIIIFLNDTYTVLID